MSDLLSQLILTDLQIANLDVGAIIAIDTPTVLLNAIDAVGIAANIIDVHHTDTVVGVGCSSREFHFLHVNKGFVNSNSIYCLFKFLAAKIANPLLTTEKKIVHHMAIMLHATILYYFDHLYDFCFTGC